MTTEDDFQAMLDAHPDDHNTRLILADWLEEHAAPRACGRCGGEGHAYTTAERWAPCEMCGGTGERTDGRRERAEGYRALATNAIRPRIGHPRLPECGYPGWSLWGGGAHWRPSEKGYWNMPEDWRALLPTGHYDPERDYVTGFWKPTRREAEDAAALAFARLPEARRRELLAPVEAVPHGT